MENQQQESQPIQNQPAENSQPSQQKPDKKLIVIAVTVVVLVLAAISGFAYWYFSKNLNISDDTGMGEAYLRSSCEKNGGQVSNITECDGTTSQACTFPGGQSCYIEQLDDGKCVGMMVPRVLCDNEKNVSQTVDWQTYRNEEYGFEFKYSSDLILYEQNFKVADSLFYLNLRPQDFSERDNIWFLIITEGSLDKKINDFKSQAKNFKIATTTIGGEEAKLVSGTITNQIVIDYFRQEIYFVHNGRNYIVGLPSGGYQQDYDLLANQILSTFKFIE